MGKKRVLLLLGPNLNMTGIREKNIYGNESYDDIKEQIMSFASYLEFSLEIFQSNWEGSLIDKIHDSYGKFNVIIINAGALSHYSYSIRDAISSIDIPFIEVHMSNIYSRETFRKTSVIADVCVGQISGFGKYSYFLALNAIKNLDWFM